MSLHALATKFVFRVACLLSASAGLISQTGTPVQSWESPAPLEISLERQEIRTYDRAAKKWTGFPLPHGSCWATFSQGYLWALTGPEPLTTGTALEASVDLDPNTRYQEKLWRCRLGEPWELFARTDPELGSNALAAYPLENDRFILFSKYFFGFKDGSYPAAFSKLDPVSGILKIERPEDLGLGGPYIQNMKTMVVSGTQKIEPALSKRNLKFLIYRNLTTENPPTMVSIDDQAIIFSMQLGVFWTFDTHGSLRRKSVLYPDIKETDYKDLFQFEKVILGWQLTPEHKILMATRSIDAVLFARKSHPVLYTDGATYPEHAMRVHDDWAAKDFPDIQWWEFDPETGNFHRLPAPNGFPVRLQQLVNPYSPVMFSFTPEGVPVFRTPMPAPTGEPATAPKKTIPIVSPPPGSSTQTKDN